MRIGIIGAGRLGICFALLCEEAGFDVTISDIRKDYIKNLQNKLIQTNEPLVQDLLSSSNNLTFTISNLQIIESCDIIFTLVATPSKENGDYDVSSVWQVINDFKNTKANLRGKTFVVGSTVNPGDCNSFQGILSELGINVLYNPEFIAQGSIINDLRNSDMVLIGGDEENFKDSNTFLFLKDLYNLIQRGYKKTQIKYMSTKAAEIAKLAVNCFLTTKISYANMLGEVLIASGLSSEINNVLDTVGTHSPIGKSYLNYGFGYGGPCLPRDNRAFADYSQKVGIKHNLGIITDKINNEHSKFLLEFLIKDNSKKLPFLFQYLSYKNGTDIITESQQLRLCKDLLDRGEKVIIIDKSDVTSQIKEPFLKKYSTNVRFLDGLDIVKEDVYKIKY